MCHFNDDKLAEFFCSVIRRNLVPLRVSPCQKRIFWSGFCSPLGEDVCLFTNSLKEHVLHEGGWNLFCSPPPEGSLSPAQLLNNSKRSIRRAALLTPAKDPQTNTEQNVSLDLMSTIRLWFYIKFVFFCSISSGNIKSLSGFIFYRLLYFSLKTELLLLTGGNNVPGQSVWALLATGCKWLFVLDLSPANLPPPPPLQNETLADGWKTELYTIL